MKSFIYSSLTCVVLLGCGNSSSPEPRANPNANKVSSTIRLKDIATGEKAPSEITKLNKIIEWTYFGRHRSVKAEILNEGTLAQISLGLFSTYEVDALKNELTQKFKKENPDFEFFCAVEEKMLRFTDAQIRYQEETCSAKDERQTLVLNRSWPVYQEREEIVKMIGLSNSVTLTDKALISKKQQDDQNNLVDKANKRESAARKDL